MHIGTRRQTMPVRRSRRRGLVWATTDQSVNIPAGQISNSNLLATLQVAGSSTLASTVMRTHLRIMVTGVTANQDTLQRVGLIVGRLSDVGINVAGQQDPSNPELDWLILDRRPWEASGAATDRAQDWGYDVKSRRRVGELYQTYLLCLSNAYADAQNYSIFAIVLLYLP